MKRCALFTFLLVLPIAAALAGGPQAITIKGMKKSEGSRKGGSIGPVRTIERTQSDLYYQFDLMNMSPALSSNLTVRWVVLAQTMRGNLREASQGSEMVSLPMGRTVSVETPIFTLKEAQGPLGKKAEAEVVGYGVRIFDPAGQLVAETYDPASARKRLEEAFEGKAE